MSWKDLYVSSFHSLLLPVVFLVSQEPTLTPSFAPPVFAFSPESLPQAAEPEFTDSASLSEDRGEAKWTKEVSV